MKTKDKVTISVYDMMGRRVAIWYPEFVDNTQLCKFAVDPSEINWQTGNYFITLSNGKETFKSKLVITR